MLYMCLCWLPIKSTDDSYVAITHKQQEMGAPWMCYIDNTDGKIGSYWSNYNRMALR